MRTGSRHAKSPRSQPSRSIPRCSNRGTTSCSSAPTPARSSTTASKKRTSAAPTSRPASAPTRSWWRTSIRSTGPAISSRSPAISGSTSRAWARSKINAAFNAGPQRVIETIEHNFNIPISHYLEVDFAGFQKLVDALGTIPIYFPTPARDRKTGLDITKAGCWHLHGDQALAYVRSRYYESYVNGAVAFRPDVGPRSDPAPAVLPAHASRSRRCTRASTRRGARPRSSTRCSRACNAIRSSVSIRCARLANAFRGSNGALQTVTLPTNRQFINGQDALVLDDAKAAPMLARLRGELDNAVPRCAEGRDAEVGEGCGAERQRSCARGRRRAHVPFRVSGSRPCTPATNADRSDYAVTEVRYAPGAENKGRLVLAQLGGAGKLVALDAAPGARRRRAGDRKRLPARSPPRRRPLPHKSSSGTKPAAAKSPSTAPAAGC